jgi:hypothetical protein
VFLDRSDTDDTINEPLPRATFRFLFQQTGAFLSLLIDDRIVFAYEHIRPSS